MDLTEVEKGFRIWVPGSGSIVARVEDLRPPDGVAGKLRYERGKSIC